MFSNAIRWIKQRVKYSVISSLLTFFIASGGAAFFVFQLNPREPVAQWLTWPLLYMAALTLVFYGSMVSVGHALFVRLVGDADLPTSERLVYSLALGLGVFALAMYVVGALGGYNVWFACLLPALMMAAGARDLPLLLRRTKQRLAARPAMSLLSATLAALSTAWGVYMLALLYLSSFTPNSFNFDAIWYHVPVAQDYARQGGIVPFYGDNHRAYPHLASFFHTWALLVPGFKHLPLRWMLMLQLELGSVIWRLVGACAVARWCLNGRKVPGLWAVFFLFPSIFIYDQNIAGSADHVLGMTAAPLFLAVARMIQRFDWRYSVLAGVAAGCHILTKYQAVYLVAATALVVALRFFWLLAKKWWLGRRGTGGVTTPGYAQLLRAPLLILGLALLVSAPHFVKNVVYYQNPFYPFAGRLFPSSFERWEKPKEGARLGAAELPLISSPHADPSGAEQHVEQAEQILGHVGWATAKAQGMFGLSPGSALANEDAEPDQRDPSDDKKSAADADEEDESDGDEEWDFRYGSRSYSFTPKGDSFVERWVWAQRTFLDWSFHTGNRHLTKQKPYMGSLFTLLLPLLLLLKPARRLWFASLYVYFAFLTWGLTNANDRYLLSFLSLPIGISAALLVRAWALGWLARIGLVALVGTQFVFATQVPLVYADKRLKDAIALIAREQSGMPLANRLNFHGSGQRLTSEFPEDALILGRYYKNLLGFDRATLNTHRPIQHYIDFRKLDNPREFWQICKDRGVTHLLYPEGRRKPVAAQDIVLFDALAEVSEDRKRVGGNVIVRLSEQPPQSKKPFQVLVKGDRRYEDGLYKVSQLSVQDDSKAEARTTKRPLRKGREMQLFEQADALFVRGNSLPGVSAERMNQDFKRVERFGPLSIWLRRESRHKP